MSTQHAPTRYDVAAALEGAISKWQGIADGTEVDKGRENCPLCAWFNPMRDPVPAWMVGRCVRCPIAIASGSHGCWETPYEDYYNCVTCEDCDDDDEDACNDCTKREGARNTALKEVAFLKACRPLVDHWTLNATYVWRSPQINMEPFRCK